MKNETIPFLTSSGENLLSIINAEIDRSGGREKLIESIKKEWSKMGRPESLPKDIKIYRFFKKHPDLTQKQIGKVFGMTGSGINTSLSRHMGKINIKWRK